MFKNPSLVDMDSLHAKSLQSTGDNYDILSIGKHFRASLRRERKQSNSPKLEKEAPQDGHLEQGWYISCHLRSKKDVLLTRDVAELEKHIMLNS